jgi:bacterioferritin-associated ferredoxin
MQATMAAVLVLASIGEVRRTDPKPSLTVTASQSNALSLEHAWRAQLNGDTVVIQRPGKSIHTRHPKPSEIQAVVRVLEATRFATLPERLGVGGVCDDCSRCVVKVDMGSGAHEVAFESAGLEPTSSPEDNHRFMTTWRAIKAVAGVTISDLCP